MCACDLPSMSCLPLLFGQTSKYPGLDGFLGTRASLMLDVVVLAMIAVVPLLVLSIWLVKGRARRDAKNYDRHKRLQLALASVLLVAVLAFEVDIRLHGWVERATASPYFDPAAKFSSPTGIALVIHLLFAVPTLLLWVIVVVQALRHFSRPPRPGPHSRWHSRLGWLAASGMTMTALTGWVFYWMAFVAR